jgi:hypothetical protein
VTLFLVISIVVVLIASSAWARLVVARTRHRCRPPDRRDIQNCPPIVRAVTTFVVPGVSASDVMRSLVADLTRPGSGGQSFILSTTDTEVFFGSGNGSRGTWASTLSVGDHTDGAHGTYKVAHWRMTDGVPVGWTEMAHVAHLVGDIVASVGGTVKVTIPE